MKMKLLANLKEKYMEMIESQLLIKAIRNAGIVLNMNIIAINKISRSLKMKRFKIPNVAYSKRCSQSMNILDNDGLVEYTEKVKN